VDYDSFLRTDRLPTSWCAGCGNGTVLRAIIEAAHRLGWDASNTVAVSGIGCSGRTAGYFSFDSIHAVHGRAVPVAEGIKLYRPELNVILVSGDGDLCGIGGNHLLHAARRDTNLNVVLVDNEIYGMTGGQTAPTTPLGTKTITAPDGAWEKPFNVQGVIKAHGAFYARSTTWHVRHLAKCLDAAFRHPGFAFVDAKSQCTSNYGRRLGYRTAYDMLEHFKTAYRINDGAQTLADDEIGITA
jgi:2-oxoglutarate ferredoxin oxidoreductase subunit beta